MKTDRISIIEKQVQRLVDAVNELQARVDFLQKEISAPLNVEPLSLPGMQVEPRNLGNEAYSRIEMPNAIRRTLKIVLKGPKRGVTSEQVSRVTGRSKNLESSYLHELHERRYLKRKRIGRKVYYAPFYFVESPWRNKNE